MTSSHTRALSVKCSTCWALAGTVSHEVLGWLVGNGLPVLHNGDIRTRDEYNTKNSMPACPVKDQGGTFITAPDAAHLAQLQDVVARHLLRFAFREEMKIDWHAA